MAIRNTSSTPISSDNWTRSFQTQNTRRASNLTVCTMTACALFLPIAVAHRTQAEPSAPQTALNAPTTPDLSASTSGASPLNSLATPLLPAPGTIAPAVESVAPIAASNAATPVALSVLAPLTAVVAGKTQKAFILPADDMTVGEALAVMGVSLGKFDRVLPDAADKFKSGMTVQVTRITIENVTRRQPIAAETRYKPTTSLAPGKTQTTQYPSAGTREIVEKVYTKNGVETLRKPVSNKVSEEPQHRIVSLGVSPRFMPHSIKPHPRYAKALSYRGGGPRDRAAQSNGGAPTLRVAKTLKVTTTAYQGAEAGGGGSRTATGMRVGYGAIAVDPRVIPLGSKLYIEGYGYGFACDTGGAIKGHKIDLAMPTISQCNAYGRKYGVTVYILSE